MALLVHLIEAYPSRSLTVIALLSIAGFAEGISVLALLPFVEIVLAGTGAHASEASRWIGQSLALAGLTPSIGSLLLLIVVGIGVKAGAYRTVPPYLRRVGGGRLLFGPLVVYSLKYGLIRSE